LIYKEPLFVLVSREGWMIDAFWYYIALGIISGIYSVFFSRLNVKLGGIFEKIKNRYNKVFIGGITLGIMIFSEYQNIAWALLIFAALSLIGKTFASIITMGSGGNGGMFGPSVVVGGLLGFVFSFG